MDATVPSTVLFVAYPGVGLLDLTGPFTVFWSASLFARERAGRSYDRRIASVQGGPIETADGLTLITEPLASFDAADIDTLVVPGSLDMEPALGNVELVDWLSKQAPRV